jgi:Nucleotidyl transferase of unknown function (DUF2204)
MLSPAIAAMVQRAACLQQLPEDQRQLYLRVIREAHRRGLRFALGGGLAASAYTGVWRNTKDLDLFVLPRDRELFVELLTSLGMEDYYDRLPYDRTWIYRGFQDDQIVDVIWEMANHRASVDEVWLETGPCLKLDGEPVPLVPPEESLWTKLYVVQRERCDWPDALNLLSSLGPDIDWDRLLARLGPDSPLLAAVLTVFAWVFPQRASDLPEWIWERLQLRRPDPAEPRAHLLDSRPWLVNAC